MSNVKLPPAIKHAIYSSLTVLPGEDRAAFEKLHKDLIYELAPVGALEHGIVATIARLQWRKENLQTFRIAAHATLHLHDLFCREGVTTPNSSSFDLKILSVSELERLRAARLTVEEEGRKDLGWTYDLIRIGTVDERTKELDLLERLDAMIDRCLKQLLHVRGIKSLLTPSFSAPPVRIPRASRLPAPAAKTATTAST